MIQGWGRAETVAAALGSVVGVAGAVAVLRPRLVWEPRFDIALPSGPSLSVALPGSVPTVASYAAAAVAALVVAVGLLLAVTRGVTLLVTRGGPIVAAYRFVTPDTPLGRMATGITLIIAVMLLGTAGLPGAIGDLGESGGSAVGGADDLAADQYAGVFADDVAPVRAATPNETADADGDGLPDQWERRGETPDGVPLPDADPEQKDLYVQVVGAETPLSASDARTLERIWAEMPVANPDGSTGVRLHVRSVRTIDRQPTIAGNGTGHRQYYTDERVGDHRCVDHLVTVGEIGRERLAVRADAPGYAVFVDAKERPGYTGTTSFRVTAVTHGLLHTVVGSVDGAAHVDEGWLTRGTPDERLADATSRRLNQSGFRRPSAYPGC